MQYILTVSEINKYIREILSKDLILSNLWVKGEISNFKYHFSGHIYFTIKDETSLIKCVMFKSNAVNLKFVPENGMKVIIKGYVSVFERDGQYQLYTEEMQPDGIGNLHVAFEQLKKKLEAEGLFARERKKKLPLLPGSIGVVTSVTGSVIRDIINVLSRRYNNFNLKVLPVQVQGESAAMQIAGAVGKFNEIGGVDVIILARGGGSLEELWAFNEEVVARSIYESRIPVISAVGHETDYTISDFVADLRAPTPSAAAELVMPEKRMLENEINTLNSRLRSALLKNVTSKRTSFEKLRASSAFRQPYNRVYQERMRLDILNKYLYKSGQDYVENVKTRLFLQIGKLDALSPLKIIARGYAVIRHKGGSKIVRSADDVKTGDLVEVSVRDGRIDCTVSGAEKGEVFLVEGWEKDGI